MAHTACKMMWLKNLMINLILNSLSMHCDNQSAIYIAQNHVFHKRTKRIEIDYHLVSDASTKKVVSLSFTPSSKQLVVLTKAASP